ncbi:MAG TPA: hypothetical protein VHP63_07305 [candidate division Zixibacteria bacterium]|nr:hypothetical protein [candidate division Zixibacteria bacterium]
MPRYLMLLSALFLALILAVSCSDDEPTAPVPAIANVLLMEDGGNEDSLYKILDLANFDVTLGGPFQNYTGTDFSAYDLVILLNGIDYTYEMPDSVETALKNYVSGGGVLLVTEWMCYTIYTFGYNRILDSILPVESFGDSYGPVVETYLIEGNNAEINAIRAGVPDSFDTRATWSYSAVFTNPRSQLTNYTLIYSGVLANTPALTMGTIGTGRVIHWSTALEYEGVNIWSPEVRRLFINIAAFSKTI